MKLGIVFLFNFGKLEFTFCLPLVPIGNMEGGYLSTNAFNVVCWKVTRVPAFSKGFYTNTSVVSWKRPRFFRKYKAFSTNNKYLCCFLENAKVCVPAPSSILQPPLLHSQKAFVLPACQTCLPPYFCSLFQCFNVNLPH